jgi:hypothetical protein
MNHHAIDILARDRIDAFAREAASGRLAHGSEPRDARESTWTYLFARVVRPSVVRAVAMVSNVRALVARA